MPPFTPDGGPDLYAGGTTGRYLVLFAEDAAPEASKALSKEAGLSVASISEEASEPESGGALVLDRLGVAVVDAPPDQVAALTAAGDGPSPIVAVEPERIVFALEVTQMPVPDAPTHNGMTLPAAPSPIASPMAPSIRMPSVDYLRGYRDAVLHLTAAAGATVEESAVAAAPAAVDETQATWGLQATKVVYSCRSGRGVRVAVLDTGMDLKHPDFKGRKITSRSFIPGEDVQDGHGHGTHCIGTALGPKCGPTRPRYGIAHGAEIFAGKVLSNRGSGTDGQILGGINWAIDNNCAVISMSLGAPVRVGQPFSTVFEAVAKRALDAGCLIVAAAGNSSQRPARKEPVGHPANCPSIMAVAALDVNLDIAPFSDSGINPDGGQVDVAGPGVDVQSTWIMPTRYRRISGTSMATPHAAGIAALHAEANPKARGAALGMLLTGSARRLTNLPSADVGAGLVQAP